MKHQQCYEFLCVFNKSQNIQVVGALMNVQFLVYFMSFVTHVVWKITSWTCQIVSSNLADPIPQVHSMGTDGIPRMLAY